MRNSAAVPCIAITPNNGFILLAEARTAKVKLERCRTRVKTNVVHYEHAVHIGQNHAFFAKPMQNEGKEQEIPRRSLQPSNNDCPK